MPINDSALVAGLTGLLQVEVHVGQSVQMQRDQKATIC